MSAQEAKIGYVTLGGWKSKAYVTLDTEELTAVGTNKHSDEPVTVRWNEALQQWEEIPLMPSTPAAAPSEEI